MALKVKDLAATENATPKVAKVDAAEKVVASVEAEAPITGEDAGKEFGWNSDKLELVAPLGDPSKPDSTPVKQADGTVKKVVTSTIVGYRFRASIDLEVPDVAPGDDFKNNLMSYTGDVNKTRKVPAGTEFDLTKFETGLLISRAEFNGRATGGDKPVMCSYTQVGKKDSKGNLVSTASANQIPGVALRALNNGQSIKDYKFIDVLDFTVIQDPARKVTRKKRTIRPGFEKFAALAKEVARAPRASSGAVADANKRNTNAEAFLKIVGAKKR